MKWRRQQETEVLRE